MMSGDMMGGWGGFGLAGALVNLLLLVGILALAAWGVATILSARSVGGRVPTGGAGAAEEILRNRFARGEMSAEEYARSMNVLNGEPQHASYEEYLRAIEGQRR